MDLPCRRLCRSSWELISLGVLETRILNRGFSFPPSKARRLARSVLLKTNPVRTSAGTRTLATKVDGGWRINGRKQWITNGPIADFATVMATIDPKLGLKGLNFYLVERKTENRDGFASGQRLHKLGSRCSVTGELVFDNVLVPDENFLGEEIGKGVQYAGNILNEVRVMTGMCALAIAKEAMQDCKAIC